MELVHGGKMHGYIRMCGAGESSGSLNACMHASECGEEEARAPGHVGADFKSPPPTHTPLFFAA